MAEVKHFYVEQNTEQSTSGSTWYDVPSAVIAGSSLTASTKYLLIARAKTRSTSTSALEYVRITTADDATIDTKSEAIVEHNGSTYSRGYEFVHSFTTSATPADVKMQLKSDGAATMYVDQVSLLLIDLDDLGAANYFEDIHAGTGLKVADDPAVTDLATIAAADLGTSEEWLLLGSAKVGVEATSASYQVRLHGAEDAAVQSVMSYMQEEGEDTNETRVYTAIGRHKAVTTAVEAKISMSMEPYLYGDTTDEGGYLIALKASAFADFEWVHETSSIVVPYYTTKTTAVASIGPYTPSTNGNHLILGYATTITNSAKLNVWLQDGSTDTRAGDYGGSVTSQTMQYDGTDYAPMYVTERISISAAKTYNLRGCDFLSSGPSMTNRWLVVLNLNLAGAAAQDITPSLTQSLATTFDPVVAVIVPAQDISPALKQQLVASYDSTVDVGAVTVTPGLVQSLAASFDPIISVGAVDIGPAMTSQLALAYDPAISAGAVSITPDIAQQLVTAYEPVIDVGVSSVVPELIQNLVTALDLVIYTGSVDISPELTQSLSSASDPVVTQGPVDISLGLAQSLTSTSSPVITTGVIDISPAIASQLATVFDPIVTVGSINVQPAIATSLATAFDITVTLGFVNILPSLVQQLITALSPVVAIEVPDITLPLTIASGNYIVSITTNVSPGTSVLGIDPITEVV